MENLVYHYTRLEALSGILRKNLCLWATRYDHLNDPSEQIWAERYALKEIHNKMGYKDISLPDIRDWLLKTSYIISLCKEPDYRNLWRLYCDDGRGVCLILDKDILRRSSYDKLMNNFKDDFCIIEDVEYASEKSIEYAINKMAKKKSFDIVDEEAASQLMRVVPFIKNDDFSIEKETRFAVLRDFDKISISPGASNMEISTEVFPNEHNVRYRMRGNELVPYLEIEFPPESLKGFILGYEVDEESAKEYINKLIEPLPGVYNIRIEMSKLYSTRKQKQYFNTLNP